MSFGTHFKALRTSKGLGVRQLAGLAGINATYLSRLEADKFEASEEVLVKLANAMGEDPDVILGLAGKVSKDLSSIIAARPKLFAALIQKFKEAPDSALEEASRPVRDGDW